MGVCRRCYLNINTARHVFLSVSNGMFIGVILYVWLFLSFNRIISAWESRFWEIAITACPDYRCLDRTTRIIVWIWDYRWSKPLGMYFLNCVLIFCSVVRSSSKGGGMVVWIEIMETWIIIAKIFGFRNYKKLRFWNE